jgi:hypothetical protein
VCRVLLVDVELMGLCMWEDSCAQVQESCMSYFCIRFMGDDVWLYPSSSEWRCFLGNESSHAGASFWLRSVAVLWLCSATVTSSLLLVSPDGYTPSMSVYPRDGDDMA